MNSRDIEVTIDELTLEGFGAVDGDRVSLAVRQELGRLLAARQFRPGARRMEHVDGGRFTLEPNARADAIGARIARGIHGGITK